MWSSLWLARSHERVDEKGKYGDPIGPHGICEVREGVVQVDREDGREELV